MKYKRKKQAKRILQLLKTTFNFHEPLQVLVDGTFCQAALKHRINIRDQLSNYLSASVKLFTTKCAVNEIESLGEPFRGGLHIIKRFKFLKCGHENGDTGAECFLSMIGEENRKRYLLATQDRSLKVRAREIPATPILTLANNAVVLEAPSVQTKIQTNKIEFSKLLPSANEKSLIAGLKVQLTKVEMDVKRHRRKVPKGPNPLSRKSSKQVKKKIEMRVGKVARSKQRRERRMRQKAHQIVSNIAASNQ